MKRKILLVIVAVCAVSTTALVGGASVRFAYAQSAAHVIEQPPPSGEVLAPVTSTGSAPVVDASAPAASTISAEPSSAAPSSRRVKTASITGDSQGKGDNKDSTPDNSPFAGFQNSSNHGPINIKSDTMSFDYKNNVVIFSGKVHAVQADSELTSNTLHVLMNKQSQIQTMIADGNVNTAYNGNVTLSLASNPGGAGAKLGGNLSVQVSNGTASFSNLTLDTAASGYLLQSTTNLASLSAWTTIGSSQITSNGLVNGLISQTITPNAGAAYYRLKSP